MLHRSASDNHKEENLNVWRDIQTCLISHIRARRALALSREMNLIRSAFSRLLLSNEYTCFLRIRYPPVELYI